MSVDLVSALAAYSLDGKPPNGMKGSAVGWRACEFLEEHWIQVQDSEWIQLYDAAVLVVECQCNVDEGGAGASLVNPT